MSINIGRGMRKLLIRYASNLPYPFWQWNLEECMIWWKNGVFIGKTMVLWLIGHIFSYFLEYLVIHWIRILRDLNILPFRRSKQYCTINHQVVLDIYFFFLTIEISSNSCHPIIGCSRRFCVCVCGNR